VSTTHLTLSGYSSGGFTTANLVAMFNEYIDSAAIFMGGGPCATRGYCYDIP